MKEIYVHTKIEEEKMVIKLKLNNLLSTGLQVFRCFNIPCTANRLWDDIFSWRKLNSGTIFSWRKLKSFMNSEWHNFQLAEVEEFHEQWVAQFSADGSWRVLWTDSNMSECLTSMWLSNLQFVLNMISHWQQVSGLASCKVELILKELKFSKTEKQLC